MSTYHLFHFDKFPQGPRIPADGQTQLMDTDLNTLFLESGYALNGAFGCYQVDHYSRVRFRGQPYSHKQLLDEVTERHRFPAYVKRDESLLVINYAKTICNEAAKRMNSGYPSLRIRRPTIDLNALLPDFKALIGSYFRDIRIPHLRSSALFGSDVDQGQFYKVMQSIGKLSAVLAVITIGSDDHKALITRDYGITFYDRYTEDFALELLLRLRAILDRAIVEETQPSEERVEDVDEQLALTLDAISSA